MVWTCHAIPFLSYSMFLFFLFRTTVKENTWMRAISVAVMVIILKIPFWKLLEIIYVQSSFSTITRHIDNSTRRTPYSWRFYRCESTYVLILSWVNIMKSKWVEVPKKLLAGQKSEPVLWRTFHQDISLIIILFFSQTNLVFKFNLLLIELFTPQFIYLLIFCVSWVHPVPLRFFIRTSNILMRLNVFSFLWFTAAKFYYVLISHKLFVPVNCKNYSWRFNNSL